MNLLSLFERKFHMPEKTTIQGNITSEIKGIIGGMVIGDININADLVIKTTGTVNGNVHAKNVLIKGRVYGNVYSEGKVYAYKNSEVEGDIFATESIIDKESVVKGKISQLHQANTSATTIPSEPVKRIPEITTIHIEKNQQSDSSSQNWF